MLEFLGDKFLMKPTPIGVLGGGFNFLNFHPHLGKIPHLTHIFQMGWLKAFSSHKIILRRNKSFALSHVHQNTMKLHNAFLLMKFFLNKHGFWQHNSGTLPLFSSTLI